ncbi:MAG: betaine/proline/choline family ABC transporter ATP-binding protein [Trueperaceae bacterium]|nr:betaine/proline/choline family ABC transporter ATP-binding protein [Trueperaceae bacterium]
MIRVENLVKAFGDEPERALELIRQGVSSEDIRADTGLIVGVRDVSFELDEGEVFVIMGLSGSGKSTLLRCINRLIEPTAGEVYLRTKEGEIEVSSVSDAELRRLRRERMSMVFQRFGLLPHRRVVDNVAYGLEIQGVGVEKRRQRAEEVLEIVGLGGWGNAFPSELSGGMQQRVGLARALATEAEVMLMDEPFSALDPLIKVEMQNELLRIQNELRRTILFITHDLDEALRIGTRIALMEAGEIVQLGTPEDIIVNPRTEYVADFVKHADPTGVMTARTIALPVPGRRFSESERDGEVRFYTREGYRNVAYGVDGDHKFREVRLDGKALPTKPLDEALAEELPDIRHGDVLLQARPDHTLRDVLQGRTYSVLPVVVVAEDGELLGVISENELIHGLLYKRANEESTSDEKVQEGAA